MHWRLNFADYVNASQVVNAKYRTGFMNSGRSQTTWKWHCAISNVALTRMITYNICFFETRWYDMNMYELLVDHVPHKHHIYHSINKFATPWYQEEFKKQEAKTDTKNDKTVADIQMGWYSKEDMKTLLKWNVILVSTLKTKIYRHGGMAVININTACIFFNVDRSVMPKWSFAHTSLVHWFIKMSYIWHWSASDWNQWTIVYHSLVLLHLSQETKEKDRRRCEVLHARSWELGEVCCWVLGK